MRLFARLTKFDPIQGIAYGTAAAEEPDRSGEIFDYASSKPNFEKWSGDIAKATDGKSFGNVRSMHSSVAAGKLTSIAYDDVKKRIEIAAKIVDKGELEKLAEGLYTGFSIGGRYGKRWPDDTDKTLTRYTAEPSEISIVDLPCIPSATFSLVKEDGSEELRKFHVKPDAPAPERSPTRGQGVDGEIVQGFRTSDGAFHVTKAEARAHQDKLDKAASPAGQLEKALEQARAATTEPVAKPADKAADAAGEKTVEKRDFSDDERKKLADSGAAMPDGSFPIANVSDLKNAIQAFGRAKNKTATKQHIQQRAKALGATDMLPDSWKDGADKAARVEALMKGVAFEGVRIQKGLYECADLCMIIQGLENLQQRVEAEAAYEQDGSKLPSNLKEDIANVSATARAMLEEETNELLDEKEAPEYGEMLEMAARPKGLDAMVKMLGDKAPAWLAKVGARHSASDKEHLDAAHDHLMKMGAGCGGGDDAEKVAKKGARHSATDLGHLNSAHDSLVKCGAGCSMAKDDMAMAAPATDLEKRLAAETERANGLEKQIAEALPVIKTLTEAHTQMRDRLAALEAQPVVRPQDRAPGAYKVVDKTAQEASTAAEELTKLAAQDPVSVAKALIFLAHQNPQAAGLAGK